MLKNTRLIVATVGIAAALIAGASVYGVTLALADNPPASRSAAQSTVTTAKSTPGTGQAVRAQVLDMLKDHMGITGAQAEQLATTMTELMQKNGITNISEMLKLCTEAGGMMTGSNTPNGMMQGQSGSNAGSNMMNGASHESHHPSTTTTAAG